MIKHMRTKTLILTAMIGAASVVASLAQTSNAVYSVNVVGYVTLTIDNNTTFRIISNPLIATNNSVNALIPTFQDGAQIFKLNPDGLYTPVAFTEGIGWEPDVQIAAGEAVFIKLSTPGSYPITFVGEVAQNAASNKQLPVGLSLQGSLVPQAGSVNTVLQVPGRDGDQIFKLPPSGIYTPLAYTDGIGWEPDESIDVAEGFFFKNGSLTLTLDWNRNFVVPQ